MNKVDYLLQRRGSCCTVFALCNALRYYCKVSPEPGNAEWEELVDFACCRHGSAIGDERIADRLGLVLKQVEPEAATPPAVLTVWNPEPVGSAMHATLIIDSNSKQVTLVNYRWHNGPLIETVPWAKVGMPDKGNQNREARNISLKDNHDEESKR